MSKETVTLRWRRFVAWLKQRGVVPRWHFILVYIMIVGVTIGGFAKVENVAKDAKRTAVRVDEARRETIMRECLATNMRHDKTFEKLDEIVRNVPADDRARAQANARNTKQVIEALVPKRDCELVLQLATQGGR